MVNRAIHLMKTPVGGGGGAVTWNPTDLSNVILSNGNLSMLASATLGGGVRSTTSHTTGRFYFEVLIDVAPDSYSGSIGFANASRAFDPNAYNVGPVIRVQGGQYYDVGTDNFGTVPPGATLGFICDLTNHYLWLVGSPADGSGGAWNSWTYVNTAYGYSVINPASPSGALSFSTLTAGQPVFLFAICLGSGIGGSQLGCTLKLTAPSFINPNYAALIAPNYGVW